VYDSSLPTLAVSILKGSGRDANGSLGVVAFSILMLLMAWQTRQQMVMIKELLVHVMLRLWRSSLDHVFVCTMTSVSKAWKGPILGNIDDSKKMWYMSATRLVF
jgi:hypothetical protein